MQSRRLGSTDLDVSVLAFGAGPVPGLLTGGDASRQRAVIARAIEAGINWFDTAATYGDGRSEEALGRVSRELKAVEQVHVATKVRLMPEELDRIGHHVRRSVEASLRRLHMERVALVQLHNSITPRRGDEPTSITPDDVLGRGGVAEALEELVASGIVRHIGLTGLGDPAAMRTVIQSGRFQTIQIPFNVLNPSAGYVMPDEFGETNYGNVIADCAAAGMGVFAIRVFAGGALVGQEPSRHTHTTKFFPLDLYRRDRQRAEALAELLAHRHGQDVGLHASQPRGTAGQASSGTRNPSVGRAIGPHAISVAEAALRFAVGHPHVTSAIVGFSTVEQVDEAIHYLSAGPLPPDLHDALVAWCRQSANAIDNEA